MEKFHYIIIVQSLPNSNYNRALALLLSSPSLERWTNSHGAGRIHMAPVRIPMCPKRNFPWPSSLTVHH